MLPPGGPSGPVSLLRNYAHATLCLGPVPRSWHPHICTAPSTLHSDLCSNGAHQRALPRVREHPTPALVSICFPTLLVSIHLPSCILSHDTSHGGQWFSNISSDLVKAHISGSTSWVSDSVDLEQDPKICSSKQVPKGCFCCCGSLNEGHRMP